MAVEQIVLESALDRTTELVSGMTKTVAEISMRTAGATLKSDITRRLELLSRIDLEEI